MPGKRRSRQQWQQVIEQWRQSGLSGREFCAREQIYLKSFYRARSRCVVAQTKSEFIQLNPSPAPSTSVAVQLPGCRIECTCSVSAAWLADLIGRLRG